MKLTDTQIQNLKLLSIQRGPMTFSGLKKQKSKVANEASIKALVNKDLVRIRKTDGRVDRYEIRAAGTSALKNNK